MDLSSVVTRLDTEVAALVNVELAVSSDVASVDLAASLKAALNTAASSRIYPIRLPEGPTYPNVVYSQVAREHYAFDGFLITRTDTYVLQLRAESFSGLVTLTAAIKSALDAWSVANQVTDVLTDYDDEVLVYRANLEVTATVPVANSQSLPAALVYPIGTQSDPSNADNCTRQRNTRQFAVMLMATTGGTITSLISSCQDALLGWVATGATDSIEHVEGAPIAGLVGLRLWREVYSDWVLITQP